MKKTDNAKTCFKSIVTELQNKKIPPIQIDKFRPMKWFVFVNAAVVFTAIAVTRSAAVGFLALLVSSLFPFGMLLISKWLAIKTHNIRLITPQTVESDYENNLILLVNELSERAGLEKPPEIGIYGSNDMNAFATGVNKNDSLVAFSTAIIEGMDEEYLAAVVAHELAHVANGDMLTMTILDAAINAFVVIVTIPLKIYRWSAETDDDVGVLEYILISVTEFAVVNILLVLGNLVVLAFSRKREFEADKCAANFLNPRLMIGALQSLQNQVIEFPVAQQSYSAFKISSPSAFCDVFSTHPSIERRVEFLQKLID